MRANIFLICILCNVAVAAQNKIQSYEYWFNGNYAARQQIAVTPAPQFTLNTLVSAAALPDGLHIFNLRFRDDSARFSSTISQFFYKHAGASSSASLINGYQYWFDNNFAGSVLQPVSPISQFNLNAPINAGTLTNGLHLLHIRFRDNSNQWSAVISQFFYKAEPTASPGTNTMVACQYWFDSDYANASNISLAAAQQVQFSAAIATDALPPGLHLLHLRFKDQRGQWSSTASQFVYTARGASGVVQNTMTKMQYWFDNDFNGAQVKPLATQPIVQVTDMINASSLPDGLHILHLRFADTLGQWSSTVSQFFYKSAEIGVTTNVISGYRYWFNDDDASKMVIHTTPPQNPLVLNTTIDMGCLTTGANRLHIQFFDKTGLFSAALTDTVAVTPPPGNVYRFTGNGNWSNAANWQGNSKPALDLPGCKEIIIDHAAGGQCILDIPQFLLKNAKLTVLPGKHLIIPQTLQLH